MQINYHESSADNLENKQRLILLNLRSLDQQQSSEPHGPQQTFSI